MSGSVRIRLAAISLALVAAGGVATGAPGDTVAPVLWQPSMNVFRRFSGDAGEMYSFYTDVLGFEPLTAFDVGGDTRVMRIRAGASELKLTGRVADRTYVEGGVDNATGLRLWTFFFSDEAALVERFERHGLPAPEFEPLGAAGRRSAIVQDPDGQLVELVITGDPPGTSYDEIEVGFVVADIETSLAFYRGFVGLEAVGTEQDARWNTTKHVFRHGSTVVTLRSFGAGLPADTGSAGIQYVVSDVDRVDALARERGIVVDQPLSGLAGFSLRTIWLDDPDGITNYFAETATSRNAGYSTGSEAR